ncbi:winged helix-turn-helix domain-containing protein [Streptomyces sp. NPDC058734]|uniref:helix-turn-helix domain-containing protein n=1 Tax=Streptomyces sp. NPDC058734 TaxID=3346615 RepID=UPI0036A6E028
MRPQAAVRAAQVGPGRGFRLHGQGADQRKRLGLLDLPAQRERTVDALAEAAGLNLTTASAHLQTLKQAGLVASRREGVRIHQRLAGHDVGALYGLLRQVAQTHQVTVERARTACLREVGFSAPEMPGIRGWVRDDLAAASQVVINAACDHGELRNVREHPIRPAAYAALAPGPGGRGHPGGHRHRPPGSPAPSRRSLRRHRTPDAAPPRA